ncbi:hypothetical protein ACRALDRAFT_2022712 [Sodiomyces alcalophilus JCM 7366]|uniref:uncharacterized protein n=1 Tax=Sodiomyces alcalophilus JCM 7366 TaxID=591952 RepID=UPI0039B56383
MYALSTFRNWLVSAMGMLNEHSTSPGLTKSRPRNNHTNDYKHLCVPSSPKSVMTPLPHTCRLLRARSASSDRLLQCMVTPLVQPAIVFADSPSRPITVLQMTPRNVMASYMRGEELISSPSVLFSKLHSAHIQRQSSSLIMSDNPGPGLTDEIVEEAHDLIQEAEEEAHMDENMQPHPELASQSKQDMSSQAKSSSLGGQSMEGHEKSMKDKVKDTLHMNK